MPEVCATIAFVWGKARRGASGVFRITDYGHSPHYLEHFNHGQLVRLRITLNLMLLIDQRKPGRGKEIRFRLMRPRVALITPF